MKAYFITATDTDAGKTFITTGLLYGLSKSGYKTLGFKPVASGCEPTSQGLRNDDALKIIAAANSQHPYNLINPYSFKSAIAPHIAAQQAGVTIDLATIVSTIKQTVTDEDYVLVEGVGGWLVPLNSQQSIADLAELLNFPVILVVNMRLGCINHALLTAQAIEQKGLTIVGWIANQVPTMAQEPQKGLVTDAMECLQDNIKSLQMRLAAPLLGVIPGDAVQQDVCKYINVEQYLL